MKKKLSRSAKKFHIQNTAKSQNSTDQYLKVSTSTNIIQLSIHQLTIISSLSFATCLSDCSFIFNNLDCSVILRRSSDIWLSSSNIRLRRCSASLKQRKNNQNPSLNTSRNSNAQQRKVISFKHTGESVAVRPRINNRVTNTTTVILVVHCIRLHRLQDSTDVIFFFLQLINFCLHILHLTLNEIKMTSGKVCKK